MWGSQELRGPSETKRLREPCLIKVELRRPTRRRIRVTPNVQNRPTYTRTIRMRQKTREPGDSANPGGQRDPGARRPRRDRENESKDHPPHQEVRDPWYTQDPHVADNVRWNESAYIPFFIKSESSSTPKGLYEKPDTVLKSERAAHKT